MYTCVVQLILYEPAGAQCPKLNLPLWFRSRRAKYKFYALLLALYSMMHLWQPASLCASSCGYTSCPTMASETSNSSCRGRRDETEPATGVTGTHIGDHQRGSANRQVSPGAAVHCLLGRWEEEPTSRDYQMAARSTAPGPAAARAASSSPCRRHLLLQVQGLRIISIDECS